eukprot:2073614-Rhodomonas_salina.1
MQGTAMQCNKKAVPGAAENEPVSRQEGDWAVSSVEPPRRLTEHQTKKERTTVHSYGTRHNHLHPRKIVHLLPGILSLSHADPVGSACRECAHEINEVEGNVRIERVPVGDSDTEINNSGPEHGREVLQGGTEERCGKTGLKLKFSPFVTGFAP